MATEITQEYKEWLGGIKSSIRSSQLKAAVSVNQELLKLYWSFGEDFAKKQLESAWGSGFFDRLSKDLHAEFPDTTGFSPTNLKYCKRSYLFYNQDNTIRRQLGDELQNTLFSIPWRHHVEIFTKAQSVPEALFYIQKTMENGWSRAVLGNFMSADLYRTQGKAITNFKTMLPSPMSDLAQQTIKDPYNFDFLTLHEGYNERQLELALTENITKFLVELGRGFAFMGRQYRIEVGGDEFFIDLLFYNVVLRSYLVVELKTTKFEPSYVGQLGFYVSAVNRQLKTDQDNPTVGLLICKTKNSVVAEYALENTNRPIGISEYELKNMLPMELPDALPTIEQIEGTLAKDE